MTGDLLAQALAFHDAGICVIPAAGDQPGASDSKQPWPDGARWTQYQSIRPAREQMSRWFGPRGYDGFGLVCGAVSGGLEMLEFEGRAIGGNLLAAFQAALDDHGLISLWKRVVNGYMEATPSGGMHILYRVAGTPRGNTKLARTAGRDVLIETRGEGGFVIAAPSGGRTHPSGKAWQLGAGGPAAIATITEDERDALYAVASLFNQEPPRVQQLRGGRPAARDGDRPGDAFNARATWEEILAPRGWRLVRSFGGAHGWLRPGKDRGMSATTRDDGGLYVFSTSTEFETETPYTKFGAYALLEHGGDYRAAARALSAAGYGVQAATVSPQTRQTRQPPGDGETGETVARQANVIRLRDVKPERVSWLWEGRLPLGKIVILDGDPGVGKSSLTTDWARPVTTGKPWPDGTPCPDGGVLILSAEDGLADTIRPRIDAAGADPARVHALTGITVNGAEGITRPPVIPADLELIEHVIKRHGVRLVIVDVLMAYLSGEVNSYRDQDVRRVLHQVSALAERTGACVVILRHLNKSSGTNALYRGGGSIGIVGQARAAFIAAADPEDDTGQRRVLAPAKMNVAAMPPALAYQLVPDSLRGCARIEWLGETPHAARDLLSERATPDEADDRTARDEAAEWLRDYLTDNGGEATPGDAKKAARDAGITVRTLERARVRAGAKIIRSGFPARTVWRLDISP